MNQIIMGWRIVFLVSLILLLVFGKMSEHLFLSVILGIIIFSIIPEMFRKMKRDG